MNKYDIILFNKNDNKDLQISFQEEDDFSELLNSLDDKKIWKFNVNLKEISET